MPESRRQSCWSEPSFSPSSNSLPASAALIGLLSLFLDPRDRGTFGSRLGVLAGALFGILLSMRAADAFIGDAGRLTLVSKIHLVALALIMATASIALLEQRHVDRGQRVIRYPDWPLVAATAGLYVLINLVLVTSAAWH
jgi:Na+/H+ antiporter NhaD/arsenite permease-like protein